jgi:hypothetical protein
MTTFPNGFVDLSVPRYCTVYCPGAMEPRLAGGHLALRPDPASPVVTMREIVRPSTVATVSRQATAEFNCVGLVVTSVRPETSALTGRSQPDEDRMGWSIANPPMDWRTFQLTTSAQAVDATSVPVTKAVAMNFIAL